MAAETKDFVSAFTQLLRQSLARPQIAASVLGTALPVRDAARPCALIFSPHPDDECLTGLLPLRLRREANWQIINVAVTLGSNLARRDDRARELAQACAVLGFETFVPIEDGFSQVNATTRLENPELWLEMMRAVGDVIVALKPDAVFLPHEQDANETHIGVHHLVMDTLQSLPHDFEGAVLQTEYWQPQAEPNLMVGASEDDVAVLLSALTCHAGEVARNPYDRRFPAYLIDNVRRGSEHLGGKGAAGAALDYAVLYRLGSWRKGKFVASALKRTVGLFDSVVHLFD